MQHSGEPLAAERRTMLPLSRFGAEASLADLFSDPITYGLMVADHVDYFDLHALMPPAFLGQRQDHRFGQWQCHRCWDRKAFSAIIDPISRTLTMRLAGLFTGW